MQASLAVMDSLRCASKDVRGFHVETSEGMKPVLYHLGQARQYLEGLRVDILQPCADIEASREPLTLEQVAECYEKCNEPQSHVFLNEQQAVAMEQAEIDEAFGEVIDRDFSGHEKQVYGGGLNCNCVPRCAEPH